MKRLRYSIRDLLLITTAVAVLCWAAPHYLRHLAKRADAPRLSKVIFSDGTCYKVLDREFATLGEAKEYLTSQGYAHGGTCWVN